MGIFGKSKVEVKLDEVVEMLEGISKRLSELEKIDAAPIVKATVKSAQASYNGIKIGLDNGIAQVLNEIQKLKTTKTAKVSADDKVKTSNRKSIKRHKTVEKVVTADQDE